MFLKEMKYIFACAFWFQLLSFANCSQNYNFCFNCISPQLSHRSLQRFLEVPLVDSSIMFFGFEHDCLNPGKIFCTGECAAVKIENQHVKYFVLGCANHLVNPAIQKNEPAGKKSCQKPRRLSIAGRITVDVKSCRCSGDRCNDLFKNFMKANYSTTDIPTADIPTKMPENSFYLRDHQQEANFQRMLPRVEPKAENCVNVSSSISNNKAVNIFLIFLLLAYHRHFL